MHLSRTRLSPDQLVSIRGELERVLRRLERNIQTNGSRRDLDQSAVGRLSRIEALQNQGLTDQLRERERTQFDEVAQALGRMDDGTYGVCTGCGIMISFDRLLVFPEARTCSGCGNGH